MINQNQPQQPNTAAPADSSAAPSFATIRQEVEAAIRKYSFSADCEGAARDGAQKIAALFAAQPAPVSAHVGERDAALEQAVAACDGERVENTGSDGDVGYNMAITHSIAAIRALKSQPTALAVPAIPAPIEQSIQPLNPLKGNNHG